ncbi:FYVE-domain-containing protein [Lichtheimia hyalospora FSU 10163]|nr:FYVE-domain-containing protein [Lichtheimia hyalospora FSU 10163]
MQPYDDRQTFLLPRPCWVNDTDVSHCTQCNTCFGPLRRRHHCRHCGHIFCHECSSRSVPLPQLGYGTKPVRVCKGCFDVAYLVTYAIDDDHGLPTQIHGTRGLLEIVEKGNEIDIQNVIMYGGIDVLIWLCRTSTSIQIHHLTTTILAMLSEREAVRPVMVTKWALPSLLHLIEHNIYPDQNKNKHGMEQQQREMALEIIINCIHVFFHMARAGILTYSVVMEDGILTTLTTLAGFEPTIRGATDDGMDHRLKERADIIQALAAKTLSAVSGQVALQAGLIEWVQNNDKFASLFRSTNGEVRKYMTKSIAYLSLRNDKRKSILLSENVARALVSTIALLPQYQDQHPEQRQYDLNHYLTKNVEDKEEAIQPYLPPNPSTISHACCALANFATSQESQIKLIAQPRLLRYICNVFAAFPGHVEIYRHITRCLANLALYENNHGLMLGYCDDYEHRFNILPTLSSIIEEQHITQDIRRHIIRAIDNLTTSECQDKPSWNELLGGDMQYFLSRILTDMDDHDTLGRAQNIQERITHGNHG